MRNSLRISPAPFKPSFLSIPPSPFSPRTPLTPIVPLRQETQKATQQNSTIRSKSVVHAPPSPVAWVWKCHLCNRDYRLGVTNRCIEDGHYYCSGTTPIKTWRKTNNPRRTKKHIACSSEFDYSGWKDWGRWRRGGPRNKATLDTSSPADSEGQTSAKPKKDCWNMCDYPSECGWGKKFGIHTPVKDCFSTLEANHMPAPTAPDMASEDVLKLENCKDTKTPETGIKLGFWTALAVTIQRKKSGNEHNSSPLSTVTQHERMEGARDTNTTSPVRYRNSFGGTLVTDSSFSDSSDSSTEGSVKPLLSRKRYRRGKVTTPKTHSYIDVRCATGIFTISANQEVSLSGSGAFGAGLESLKKAQSWHSGYHHPCTV